MEKKITIRENTEEYMQELREWAGEARKGGLEEMAAFFRNRLGEYEEHMSMWNAAYKRIGTMIPEQTEKLLDLGCGTGLELDEISAARPSLQITGIDLSPDMLAVLAKSTRRYGLFRPIISAMISELRFMIWQCPLNPFIILSRIKSLGSINGYTKP